MRAPRIVVVAVGLVIAAMASAAWLSDDAYITLRVVDNLWSGFGLRWNPIERVQVYTHPLWMLVLAACYGMTREAYWTTIGVSLALSATVVVVLASRLASDRSAALATLGLALASKAFIEFSTSGLENPLSHLLLVSFLLALLGARDAAPRPAVAALLAGLSGVCRLDLLALTAPPLISAVWARPHETGRAGAVRLALIAVAPLLAWSAFAFVYYGTIVPNTALAKLPPNIGLLERIPQGLRYLADALVVDPVTAVTIGTVSVWAWRSGDDRGVAVGLLAGIASVVAVGGDFMTGRFLTAPFVVSLAWLARRISWTRRTAGVVAAASLVVGVAMPQSPLRFWHQPMAADPIVTRGHGIIDERALYAPYTGLVAVVRGSHPRQHPWARGGAGLQLSPRVVTFEAVGLLGYHAGPGAHIVDPMALTEPLLARLPADTPWRIGHFRRPLPSGYVPLLESCVERAFPSHAIAPPTITCLDDLDAMRRLDPAVAREYERIAIVTQRPLWDRDRMSLLARGGIAW